jgi:uncharacterized protein
MQFPERVESLREKHQRLDLAVQAENKRASPDERALKRLKREKLLIKEEIDRLVHA